MAASTESGPAEAAVEAHIEAFLSAVVFRWDEQSPDDADFFRREWGEKAHAVLAAAHDPKLGPDRSVRLGDVTQALREVDPDPLRGVGWCADFLERHFTEQSS